MIQPRIDANIPRFQHVIRQLLSVSSQTAIEGQANGPHDGRQLRSCWLRLMKEDDPNKKIQAKRKTYAPVAFGSKTFSPAQIQILHLRERNFSDLLRIHGIWTPLSGRSTTRHCAD